MKLLNPVEAQTGRANDEYAGRAELIQCPGDLDGLPKSGRIGKQDVRALDHELDTRLLVW